MWNAIWHIFIDQCYIKLVSQFYTSGIHAPADDYVITPKMELSYWLSYDPNPYINLPIWPKRCTMIRHHYKGSSHINLTSQPNRILKPQDHTEVKESHIKKINVIGRHQTEKYDQINHKINRINHLQKKIIALITRLNGLILQLWLFYWVKQV